MLKIVLSQNSMLLGNAAKNGTVMATGDRIYGPAEVGIYYSNVYEKISFAPSNIARPVTFA